MKNDLLKTDVSQQVLDLMPTKRKIGADVFLLIFICLLVLISLTTLTFLKFGSEQVLTGELALAEEESTPQRIVSVATPCSVMTITR